LAPELAKLLAVTTTSGVLALTLGWVASVGRGYLPAIGALIVIIAAAQVAVLFGTGGWFPFAIPGLIAVAGTEGAPQLSVLQLALVPGIVAAAAWLTLRWWAKAEVS
jgi:ABC-2 type transport system permease protein